MTDPGDRFSDVYEDKFDLGEHSEHGDTQIDPADSRVLDEYVENNELDPEDIDIDSLIDIGLNYIQINRYEQAAETFNRALKIDPENQEAWVNLGYAHAEMTEYDQAIGAYRECISIDDSTQEASRAYLNLAYAEDIQGYQDSVLRYLNKALDIDQRFSEAWYNKGYFLNERQRYSDALRCIENAISLGLRQPYVLEEKSRALEGLERYQEAQEIKEEAEQIREDELRGVIRE